MTRLKGTSAQTTVCNGEVVRKAKSDGPQRITVHGREEVIVVSVEEYRRIKGQPSGQVLVKLLQESPLHDLEIDRTHTRSRVRPVKAVMAT